MRPDRFRAYNPDGNVVHSGDVPASGQLNFNSGEDFVEVVVFYSGDPEVEAVSGSVEVQRTGAIKVELE